MYERVSVSQFQCAFPVAHRPTPRGPNCETSPTTGKSAATVDQVLDIQLAGVALVLVPGRAIPAV